MDLVHLHLMLNHVPILGVAFGLAIGTIGLLSRSRGVIRIGLGVLAFSAIVAVPVYLTGEPAEELAEGLPGVSEGIIGQHESAATISFALTGVSGALAAITLLFWRSLTSKLPTFLVTGTLLVTALTMASMVRTANLGGQIRHTEIRAAAGGTATEGKTSGRKNTERDDDD